MSTTRVICTRPDGSVTVNALAANAVRQITAVRAGGDPAIRVFLAGMRYPKAHPLADQPLTVSATEALVAVLLSPVTADAALVEIVKTKDVPADGTDVRVCQEADLYPRGVVADHRWRDCWRRVGTGLPGVNLALARAQRMNEVRQDRVAKLAKADIDIRRAEDLAQGVLEGQLRVYRQQLRDVPTTNQASLDASATVAALEAWMPTWPTDPGP